MKLPEAFLENIKRILPEEEFPAFASSFDTEERYSGIRANTLKTDADSLPELTKSFLKTGEKVPWCENGFYYTDGQPGRNALYHAGVYYIQEPSAMYPAANVPIPENARVLDICAAPGGKSTQLAARMNGEGRLVANDISEERTKALVKNLQMAGVVNAVVTNETPEKLAEKFADFFDVIVVDAPCSGEGMFRKDEEAVRQWESYRSDRCRKMQDGILESVHVMLREGGVLSYSTCTFNKHENEGTLADFMGRHPEYRLIEAPKKGGVAGGLEKDPDGVCDYEGFEKASRLWPHRLHGEGHFTAFLRKGEITCPEAENAGKLRKMALDDISGPAENISLQEREIKAENGGVSGDFADISGDFADISGKYSDRNKNRKNGKYSDFADGRKKEKRGKNVKKERYRSFRHFDRPPQELEEFFEFYMTCEPPRGCYFYMGENLYYLPEVPPDIDGLKVKMAGVYCGEVKGGEFKMSHRLALTLKPEDFVYCVELANGSDALERYLRGETVIIDAGNGVETVENNPETGENDPEKEGDASEGNKIPEVRVKAYGEYVRNAAVAEERLSAPCCVAVSESGRSFVLGLGGISGGAVKNLYPKGWRRFG